MYSKAQVEITAICVNENNNINIIYIIIYKYNILFWGQGRDVLHLFNPHVTNSYLDLWITVIVGTSIQTIYAWLKSCDDEDLRKVLLKAPITFSNVGKHVLFCIKSFRSRLRYKRCVIWQTLLVDGPVGHSSR